LSFNNTDFATVIADDDDVGAGVIGVSDAYDSQRTVTSLLNLTVCIIDLLAPCYLHVEPTFNFVPSAISS